ncbi:hypothetical protein UT300005_26790 [Clostridium sp. CTA-5]
MLIIFLKIGKIILIEKERMNVRVNIEHMKIEEVIEQINLLYKKSKEEGLSAQEKELQQKLRRRYIENVKKNFRVQLEGIEPKK